MKTIKKILSITIIIALLACICVMSTVSSSASGTGAGLTEWCLNAYYSGWSYVYGGASEGAVDCSGLIYSYAGGIRTGDAQLYNSSYTGNVADGVPRIHGLGLWKPGHVGVYVGDGMAVDARGSQWGVCYESVYSHGWTQYFKVPGVSYPSTGWVTVSGSKYYYENGQYLVDTTKTIDGVSYTFSSNGKCSSNGPSEEKKTENDDKKDTTSTESSTLKKGSTGTAVEKLQFRLYELGYYTGPIDGDFGNSTEAAFMLFQEQAGLYVDGIAGNDVEYLYADDAPAYEAEIVNNKSDEEIAQTNADDETEEMAQEAEEETPTSFAKGDYHEEIVKIQERLSDLSYYNGTADGSYGTMTEDAVVDFQGANAISQTGAADEFTIEMLYSEDAVENPVKDEPTEALEVVESEIPQSAKEAKPNVIKASEAAPATEVALETNKLSEKALAGIADSISFESDTNGNNFQFIFWLAIMIIVMGITFIIVNTIEKKKQGKATSRKYF